VEQIGPPEEIYHSPRTVFVANFIGQANLLSARVVGVMDGRAVVTVCGEHRLEIPVDGWTPVVGGLATLMVRPERMRVSPAANAPRAVPATLTTALFQGSAIRALLRTADGSELTVHVAPDDGAPPLSPGTSYDISWDADAARLLPPAKNTSQLDLNLRTTIELAGTHTPRPTQAENTP
jgi:ABC-type Fe3+/spermidine/putrescine transport system ATPase subunit